MGPLYSIVITNEDFSHLNVFNDLKHIIPHMCKGGFSHFQDFDVNVNENLSQVLTNI
jgi:hypothetical protein